MPPPNDVAISAVPLAHHALRDTLHAAPLPTLCKVFRPARCRPFPSVPIPREVLIVEGVLLARPCCSCLTRERTCIIRQYTYFNDNAHSVLGDFEFLTWRDPVLIRQGTFLIRRLSSAGSAPRMGLLGTMPRWPSSAASPTARRRVIEERIRSRILSSSLSISESQISW